MIGVAKIVVRVLPPGGKTVLVLDAETNRLLLYTKTFAKYVNQGEYTKPEDIVEIFKTIATRSHETRGTYNPHLVYQTLESILLSDIPLKEKVTQVLRYVRAAVKS